ncbi:MAG: lytic transglycosylase domain-containing protein [Muribaculaceae bacterium]|nr:lytic transglycosylase domain-containing protein [Muribaculaceae bacterium]
MNRLIKSTIIAIAATAFTAAAQTPSAVLNPTVPSAVTFAGSKINLDRADMYERYDRELTALAFTHGNTLLTIKRANKYFPLIAPVLQRYGVPADLIYIACIESYLNPRAYSPAKAAGLWQFIPAAAKQYGLEVNEYVDERYHPVKATEAACKFLKSMKNRFGNWESAAAGYNAGSARIARDLEAQGVTTAHDLYLPDETSRYIFRLLAMKEIMENPAKYGFTLTPDQLYYPVECSSIKVTGPVEDWAKWAKSHGTNYMTLRDLNPWIRAKSLPNKSGKTYNVLVPKKGAVMRSNQPKKVYNPKWTAKN